MSSNIRLKRRMAPNVKDTNVLHADKEERKPLKSNLEKRDYKILYEMVLLFAYLHVGAMYGLYLAFTSAKWATIALYGTFFILVGMSISAGAHRLWAHRSYKAKMPLQILLMFLHTMTGQTTIHNWVRDHRLHHKYCDTDADPYCSARGLFFSHMGWLLVNRHPECIQKGKEVDISDVLRNPVLRFQKKYFIILSAVQVVIIPVLVPVYFWGESLFNAHFLHLLTITVGSHVTFCINSIAHAFGTKSQDKNLSATNIVSLSLISSGEGYHNYHHAFPVDYRLSEFGNEYTNFSRKFIEFFAWIGLAYDLKYASPDMIANRMRRTGDGTY